MKAFKSFLKIIAAAAFTFSLANATARNNIQENLTGKALKGSVAARNFVFKAQTVFPETGTVQQLTSGNYTLTITNNGIVADIPYFAKASAASIDPSQGGLQFKSANFKYTESKIKRGWVILLEPKDVGGDNLQMLLTVYNDGAASLEISSTDRQSVAFDGFIEAQK